MASIWVEKGETTVVIFGSLAALNAIIGTVRTLSEKPTWSTQYHEYRITMALDVFEQWLAS